LERPIENIMTKKELIKFLEPYSDETKILTYHVENRWNEREGLSTTSIYYAMKRSSIKPLRIQEGEGIIVIR